MYKRLVSLLLSLIIFLLFQFSFIFSTQNVLIVEVNEFVAQEVIYNPIQDTEGIWVNTNQNQTSYELRGEIVISNVLLTDSISDIIISFENIENISIPTYLRGRIGIIESYSSLNDSLTIYIPYLGPQENSTWQYSINISNVRPPLSLISNYSDPRILAGQEFQITDTIQNNLDFACIDNITIIQNTLPINFTQTSFDIEFNDISIQGPDSSNVLFSVGNTQMNWNVLGGSCLNENENTSITYSLEIPLEIPVSDNYQIIESILEYTLNTSLSQIRVSNIDAISSSISSFEKNIVGPSTSSFSDLNVTWNVSSNFSTQANDISYELREVTMWVSQRDFLSSTLTNPDTTDNDTISNLPLRITYNPTSIINNSNSWNSPNWLFNYTENPQPIVWMQVDYAIHNDGVQLINRTTTQNENDIFIKELYIVVGYWLQVEKNITQVNNNTYFIEINVKNKGNSPTPENAIITVYDFLPSNFNVSGIVQLSDVIGGWYWTASSASTLSAGPFNGTLLRWALNPTGNYNLNASFNKNDGEFNFTNTWSANYTIIGSGEYSVSEVFLVGIDPQRVDGAGGSEKVEINQQLNLASSFERTLGIIAGILIVLGVLI